MRVQRYDNFLTPANFSVTFFKKSALFAVLEKFSYDFSYFFYGFSYFSYVFLVCTIFPTEIRKKEKNTLHDIFSMPKKMFFVTTVKNLWGAASFCVIAIHGLYM